jgi:hypothetical protein
LGEVRDLLAGLRCPELDRLAPLPDARPVEVTTSLGRVPGGLCLGVAVEIPGARLPKGRA